MLAFDMESSECWPKPEQKKETSLVSRHKQQETTQGTKHTHLATAKAKAHAIPFSSQLLIGIKWLLN
jgi:hypothetical protein